MLKIEKKKCLMGKDYKDYSDYETNKYLAND